MKYKKVGGIHFIRVWRFNCSLSLQKSATFRKNAAIARAMRVLNPPAVKSVLLLDGRRVLNRS